MAHSTDVTRFGEEPFAARLIVRWGHSAPVALCAAIVAVIVMGLYPLSGTAALTVPVAVLGVVLTSWLAMRRHDRSLCERCVAALPLNPAERAVRCQRMFWVTHRGLEPRYLVPYLTVLIGSNFATSVAGRVAWAVIQSSMIYLILAYTSHRRLQPWCPWCRGGDGGGERDDVAPPPPPVDRHQPV